jgi:peptidoglycan/LPS O-acetylase OafA/YrhL
MSGPTDSSPQPQPIGKPLPPPPAATRFHQLDGLRAVAVLLVVAHHSISSGVRERLAETRWHFFGELAQEMTRSGVDLFFVLSGVLLLRPYLRGGRRFDAGTYARRRVERLWPAYLAAWALSGLALLFVQHTHTWWTTRFHHWPSFSIRGWAAQLLIVNLGWDSYNSAWWSLTVELLFYVLVLLLIPLLTGHSGTKMAATGLVLLSVGVSVVGLSSMGVHAPLAIEDLVRYSPCFAWGVLLAATDLPVALARAALPFGLGWAAFSVYYPPANIHIGWSLAYAAVVVIVLAPKSRLGSILSASLLVWLGERSYSLFLTHFVVFDAVNASLSHVLPGGLTFFLVSRATAYAAAMLVAMAVFHLVERRFARGLVTADQFWPPLRFPRGSNRAASA